LLVGATGKALYRFSIDRCMWFADRRDFEDSTTDPRYCVNVICGPPRLAIEHANDCQSYLRCGGRRSPDVKDHIIASSSPSQRYSSIWVWCLNPRTLSRGSGRRVWSSLILSTDMFSRFSLGQGDIMLSRALRWTH